MIKALIECTLRDLQILDNSLSMFIKHVDKLSKQELELIGDGTFTELSEYSELLRKKIKEKELFLINNM